MDCIKTVFIKKYRIQLCLTLYLFTVDVSECGRCSVLTLMMLNILTVTPGLLFLFVTSGCCQQKNVLLIIADDFRSVQSDI